MKATERDLPQEFGTAAPSAGRVLAVDYGRRRIGLAISDELRLTAQPLAVFSRSNRANDLRRLRELCREHHIKQIVVGHPKHLSGAASEMAQEASRFAARLKKNLGLPVELVDERLTSWEAAQTVAQTHSPARRANSLDHLAAALILREFLDQSRSRDLSPGPGEAR
jgi:putative Holliday junction resolvase